MRNLGVTDEKPVQRLPRPRLGITTDADDGRHAQGFDDHAEQLVAFLVHRRHDLGWELLRDDIAALLGVLKEQQRTVIMHQVVGEEGFGFAEALLE